MRIDKNTPPVKRKTKPIRKWQTGDYGRSQEFRYILPYSFLFLCKLWGITPDGLITDFIDNLATGSWKREGRDEAKKYLQEYVFAMNYGQEHYTKEDIHRMFIELDAVGMLWPGASNEKMMMLHVKWRDNYYNWWFKKWHRKYRRKL